MEVKQLSHLTVCTLFEIRTPIWGGSSKRRVVGLNEQRITKHNLIKFSYTRKDGTKSLPDDYYFDGDDLKEIDYERQNVHGTTLVLIPFSHLRKLERI